MNPDQTLSRRRFLSQSVAVASAWQLRRAAYAMGFPANAPVCRLEAEQEVGPYYVSDELVRSDIREGKAGVPLRLRLLVDSRTCRPLREAAVDTWHCDALGLYAGFTKVHNGPPPGFDPQHPRNRPGPPEGMGPPPSMKPTDELTFLRGIQFTDPEGRVEFETVFPGFYMGRTNHIHFKVREGGRLVERKESSTDRTYIEGHTAHIGQVFFPEQATIALMQQEPYAKHQIHRTTQAEDGIFQEQHGATSVAKLRPVEARSPELGYMAELVVAVDPTTTPKEVGHGGPPPPHAS